MKQQPLIRPIFFVFILFAFLNIGSAQTGITYEFDDHFNITSDGVSFPLPFKGEANLYAPDDEPSSLRFRGLLNLNPLNKKLTEILRKQVNAYDECGERLNVKKAHFNYVQKGNIGLKVKLHYEKWECEEILSKRIKTRLFEQSGSIQIEITPKIKQRGVNFLLKVIDVDANGVLGTLIEHSSNVRQKIIKTVENKLPNSLGTSLTQEFKDLDVLEIRQVRFISGPNLQLEVVAKDELDTLLDYALKYKKRD